MKNNKLRKYSILLSSIAAVGIFIYILIENYKPFGGSIVYGFGRGKVSELGPKERVKTENQEGNILRKVNGELVYFTTKIPPTFNNAKVKITWKDVSSTGKIYVGFKDQQGWHYNTELIGDAQINLENWSYVGNNPLLYQKSMEYQSAEEFINSLPANKTIGLYNYDEKELLSKNPLSIPGYKPAEFSTVIKTPLRGKHIFYVYVANEPFRLSMQKQDLNWYRGEDMMTVEIYKEGDLVFEHIADDDGINDSSKKVLPPQDIQIQNPGPELPEPGVYKVVVDTGGDTIIKNITTNLHKIVFEGPVFPIDNNELYPDTATNITPSVLYTDSISLKTTTYHASALQTIFAGSNNIDLLEVKKEVKTNLPPQGIYQVVIPKSDVIISGNSYFSFEMDQFFKPSRVNTIKINDQSDLEHVDYILSSFKAPKRSQDGWTTNEVDFDLSSAVLNSDGKVSWIIKTPGLLEDNREILIKSIEVELYKEPLKLVRILRSKVNL